MLKNTGPRLSRLTRIPSISPELPPPWKNTIRFQGWNPRRAKDWTPSPPLLSAVISAFYDQRFIGSSSLFPPLFYLASFLNQSINCTDVPEEKEWKGEKRGWKEEKGKGWATVASCTTAKELAPKTWMDVPIHPVFFPHETHRMGRAKGEASIPLLSFAPPRFQPRTSRNRYKGCK